MTKWILHLTYFLTCMMLSVPPLWATTIWSQNNQPIGQFHDDKDKNITSIVLNYTTTYTSETNSQHIIQKKITIIRSPHQQNPFQQRVLLQIKDTHFDGLPLSREQQMESTLTMTRTPQRRRHIRSEYAHRSYLNQRPVQVKDQAKLLKVANDLVTGLRTEHETYLKEKHTQPNKQLKFRLNPTNKQQWNKLKTIEQFD